MVPGGPRGVTVSVGVVGTSVVGAAAVVGKTSWVGVDGRAVAAPGVGVFGANIRAKKPAQ